MATVEGERVQDPPRRMAMKMFWIGIKEIEVEDQSVNTTETVAFDLDSPSYSHNQEARIKK